jgi:SAM-dependent methyltransferase
MSNLEVGSNKSSGSSYVPALGYRLLTPLYDRLLRLTMREDEFKSALIAEARVKAGDRVLDLGCGTGTLLVMLQRECPEAQLTGIDGDPDVLRLAAEKARSTGGTLDLRKALAVALPFPDSTFDHVLSTLVFHHLTTIDKTRALNEAYRVLRPGGLLLVADWGQPQNTLMLLASLGIRLLDGSETTRANLEGRLPELMEDARFDEAREVERRMTMFGTLSLYRGMRPRRDGSRISR